jgi:hypothetical protein
MKAEGSAPYSQQLNSETYPVLDESSPHPNTILHHTSLGGEGGLKWQHLRFLYN